MDDVTSPCLLLRRRDVTSCRLGEEVVLRLRVDVIAAERYGPCRRVLTSKEREMEGKGGGLPRLPTLAVLVVSGLAVAGLQSGPVSCALLLLGVVLASSPEFSAKAQHL